MQYDYKLANRRFVIYALFVIVIVLYMVRLFNLQVTDDKYKALANDNAFLTQTVYPSRGLIYDREHRELVFNQPAYDLLVTMRNVKNLDTLDFCNTLGITREVFDNRMAEIRDRRRNPGFNNYTQQVFTTQLTDEVLARMQEALYRFEGFDMRLRTVRQYKYPIAPLIVGSVREVNPKEMKADPYYQRGDYVGDFGVEKSYENYLRGEKGRAVLLRDVHGRIIGHVDDGEQDVAPVAGHDLTLTIDAELQQYAESLMVNKIGALVAIEPSTGEVLALVSSPGFDPRMLTGHSRASNYSTLGANPYKPLYNRAISASYPPGSTFKPTQGLIGLQEGVISQWTSLPCNGGFVFGNFRMGCHDGTTSWTLAPAIATSCNGYFGWCLYRVLTNQRKYPKRTTLEAFEMWKDYMVSMGYGYRLGIDLPSESRGFIPNPRYYSRNFGTESWSPVSVISISIGQGEILATPLQIANLAATIANRGYYFVPHIVKEISGIEQIPDTFLQPHRTMVEPKHYDVVVEGMRQAVTRGTVHSSGNLAPEGIELCGKTGTAQNPHGRDHSVFMGFAPRISPRIAVCCYVENAGFGATFGVPIGTLVIEKYLNDTISERRKPLEQSMMEQSTLQWADAYTQLPAANAPKPAVKIPNPGRVIHQMQPLQPIMQSLPIDGEQLMPKPSAQPVSPLHPAPESHSDVSDQKPTLKPQPASPKKQMTAEPLVPTVQPIKPIRTLQPTQPLEPTLPTRPNEPQSSVQTQNKENKQ